MSDERQSVEDLVREAYDGLEAADSEDQSARVTGRDNPGDTGQAPLEAKPEAQVPDTEPLEDRIPPPPSWGKNYKDVETWQGLPRQLQEQIYQREHSRDRETNIRIQQLAEKRKYYEGIERTLQPYVDELSLQGFRPEQVVEQSLALYKLAKQDKAAAARWFLNELGLDPTQLSQETPQIDPNTRALMQRLQGLETYIQSQTQAQAETFRAQLEAEVDSFATEKGPDGKPLYPHIAALADEMIPHLHALRAANPNAHPRVLLKEAHDRAYWANPHFRELELGKVKAEKIAEEKRKAESAKRAAVQVNGSVPVSGAQPAPTTVEDAVRQAWDRLT